MPGARADILAMVNWVTYMTADRRTAWGIPAPEYTALVTLRGAAEALLPGTGELDPAGDYGYVIYLGIMPPGGATLEQAASTKHYLREPPRTGWACCTTALPGGGRRSSSSMRRMRG
jgi:hypothetical protein